MALPKKNQVVTVVLSTDAGFYGERRTFTGPVATVSRLNGEFSVMINGRANWFGPESIALLAVGGNKMRLYGSTRFARRSCPFGCCGEKEASCLRHTALGRAAKKAARKRARRSKIDATPPYGMT